MDRIAQATAQVIEAHTPKTRTSWCCDDHDPDLILECAAADCNWYDPQPWAEHIFAAIRSAVS
jgi:hypothetical protein